MKDWVFGRKLMEEQPAPGGEGGGGGADLGPKGATGTPGDKGAAATGEEEHRNALGEELNKGGEGDQGGKGGEQQPEKKDPPPDPNAPTEEEVKAYNDAIKLDEEAFGKGAKLDEKYASQLPAFFKKHGIAADRANAIVNDFVKMQKEAAKGKEAEIKAFEDWREAEIKRMNDAYYATYDQAGRKEIADAIKEFIPQFIKDENGKEKLSPMFQAITTTEIGVDPGFLRAMKFIGERLAKDKAPGAAAGAGSGGGKDITDLFMGK